MDAPAALLKPGPRAADPGTMDRPRHPLHAEAGMTLVELMAAALVLVVGMLGTLVLVDGSNARISENRTREAATNLAREIVEGARAVPYPEITSAGFAAKVQSQPGLGDAGPAEGWNLVRRGVTFTVQTDACTMDDDDPRDGTGDHTGMDTFCPDSPGGGTVDRNPDDYKRVTITVSWRRQGDTESVHQVAIINNPGSSFAPTVRDLKPTSPALTAPYAVKSATTGAITFTARVTPRAAYVNWSVDNIRMGSAARSGSTDDWTFTWSIPSSVPDGVYLVGAQGYNSADQTGSPKAITVTLNRFRPTPPPGFAGGRNDDRIEFEWLGSGDRDIVGYRVYQMVGAAPATTDPVACETSVSDPNPTACSIARDSGGDKRYYVVARAPACCTGTGTEESVRPTAAQTLLVTSNNEPEPPTTLSATRDGEAVTLTWTAPEEPAAGEPEDVLRSFRIYRDGLAYENRYALVEPDRFTWTDVNAGPEPHSYWVVSVDSHLAESDPVGEVRR